MQGNKRSDYDLRRCGMYVLCVYMCMCVCAHYLCVFLFLSGAHKEERLTEAINMAALVSNRIALHPLCIHNTHLGTYQG